MIAKLVTCFGFGVAVAMSLGQAAPAMSAAVPRWHIVHVLGSCPGDDPIGVSATGPGDAWSVGLANAAGPGCPAGGIVAEHWNGSRWAPIAAQPVAVGQMGLTGLIPASSARNAWDFPLVSGTTTLRDVALNWNGTGWTTWQLPGAMTVSNAAAFSRTDAWVFGSGPRGPVNARFDGSGWRRTVMPGPPFGVSALSASDMWAVGPTSGTARRPPSQQVLIAMHWTGTAWHTRAIPHISFTGGTRLVNAGNVAAAGPHSLWWAYQTESARGKLAPGGRLLHWNGTRWTSTALPDSVGISEGIQQDGHGGIWLNALDSTVSGLRSFVYHYWSGRWTRQRLPSPAGYDVTFVDHICWIPGTQDIWAVGYALASASNAAVGVIEKYS